MRGKEIEQRTERERKGDKEKEGRRVRGRERKREIETETERKSDGGPGSSLLLMCPFSQAFHTPQKSLPGGADMHQTVSTRTPTSLLKPMLKTDASTHAHAPSLSEALF